MKKVIVIFLLCLSSLLVFSQKENKQVIGNDIITVNPNPVHNYCEVGFSLSENSKVIIELYNLEGLKILQIINEEYPSGVHTFNCNLSKLTQGTYYMKFTSDKLIEYKKLIIVK